MRTAHQVLIAAPWFVVLTILCGQLGEDFQCFTSEVSLKNSCTLVLWESVQLSYIFKWQEKGLDVVLVKLWYELNSSVSTKGWSLQAMVTASAVPSTQILYLSKSKSICS